MKTRLIRRCSKMRHLLDSSDPDIEYPQKTSFLFIENSSYNPKNSMKVHKCWKNALASEFSLPRICLM
jgi:hypothetical protein